MNDDELHDDSNGEWLGALALVAIFIIGVIVGALGAVAAGY